MMIYMKIAILLDADISNSIGTSIRAKRIEDVLKEEHDVNIIYSGKQSFENVFSMILSSLTWNLKLFFIIPRRKIDLIYLSSDFLGFFSVILLSKFKNYKLIFESHGIFSKENINKNRNKIVVKSCQLIEKFVISNSDCIITLSKDIFNYYRNFNQNIFLIPSFVDESIKPKVRSKSNNGLKSIGLIGPFNMPSNKHYLDFLYQNIDKLNPNLFFSIIGSCDYRIKNKRIEYTGYMKSYPDYISKIASMDLVLIPSQIPTSGPLTKILESMLCSVPVLTTPEGTKGLDYIKWNENMLVCEKENLVHKLNESIFDEDLMKKISKNGGITVQSHYTKKINEKKLFKVIDQFKNS